MLFSELWWGLAGWGVVAEHSSCPSQDKSHVTVCQVTSHQEAFSREQHTYTLDFTHTDTGDTRSFLCCGLPPLQSLSLHSFTSKTHWSPSACQHPAFRHSTGPVVILLVDKQPRSAEISELHLPRNRTLWPLPQSAFLTFHFMCLIHCSDFIY